jgi:hypothetical protein
VLRLVLGLAGVLVALVVVCAVSAVGLCSRYRTEEDEE